MASGSGTSGVAGGAGKYDEKKHKRDDSGQFSSTGGGGGGAAEKPRKQKPRRQMTRDEMGEAKAKAMSAWGKKWKVGKEMSETIKLGSDNDRFAKQRMKDNKGKSQLTEEEVRKVKTIQEVQQIAANRGYKVSEGELGNIQGTTRMLYQIRESSTGKHVSSLTPEQLRGWLTTEPKTPPPDQKSDFERAGDSKIGSKAPAWMEQSKPEARKPDAKADPKTEPTKAEPKKPEAKKPVDPPKSEGEDDPGWKSATAKAIDRTSLDPKRAKKATIPEVTAVLGNRGYKLGRGVSEPVNGKWTTSYEVHGKDGSVNHVEAKELLSWLAKDPKSAGDLPGKKVVDGKSGAKAGAKKPVEKPAGKQAEKTVDKPSEKAVEKPAEKPTADSSAPPAGGPPKFISWLTHDEAAQVAADRGYKLGEAKTEVVDGKAKVSYDVHHKDGSKTTVDAKKLGEWVTADDSKVGEPPGEKSAPKPVAKPDSAKPDATNDSPAHHNVARKKTVAAESPQPKASKWKEDPNIVTAEVVEDNDNRTLYQRVAPKLAAAGSKYIASVLGLHHTPGPNGSRVVHGGMKEVHDELKSAGYEAVQAFQSRMGPIINYHHRKRGLVASIQRHGGRKGRTALKLIGMLTGLKKAASGEDGVGAMAGTSQIGTLISLAGDKVPAGKKAAGKKASGKKLDGKKKRSSLPLAKLADPACGCAMVRIPEVGSIREEIVRLQTRVAVEDLVGFEDTPHVTVRYGIRGDAERVEWAVSGIGSVSFRLGRLDFFTSSEHDVLFVRVMDEQGELSALRRKIEEGVVCDTSSFPQYIPHVTIAYLKPGTAERYLNLPNNLFGVGVTCHEIRYATKSDFPLMKRRNELASLTSLSPLASIGNEWKLTEELRVQLAKDFAAGGAAAKYDETTRVRDDHGRFSGTGASRVASGQSNPKKYDGPVDSLSGEHKAILPLMPAGSRVDPTVGGRVNVNWDSDAGGGREHLDRVITAAKIAGFKSHGEEISHDQNGDIEGRSEYLSHPDGHKLYVLTEAAAAKDGGDRHAAMMIMDSPPKARVRPGPEMNQEHTGMTTMMPQGSVVMSTKSGVTTSSWSSEGADGIQHVNRMIEDAKANGFKLASRNVDRERDGSVSGVRAVYSHPDGHKLEIDREVMSEGHAPFHSALLTMVPKRAKVVGEVVAKSVAKKLKEIQLPSVPLAKRGDENASQKFADHFAELARIYQARKAASVASGL